ncbi:MAG: formimidoylglutamate deiminase [Betaproteobacteria bacterium]
MPLFARDALLPAGWATDVLLDWDTSGRLTQVREGAACPPGVATPRGPVIPGMPNVHSHAFQHVFAGLTETRGHDDDSFWSWRTLMYRFAARITPAQLETIATHLYQRMLRGGYTSVCEFHYLHHDRDGRAYADAAETSSALLRAARSASIGITLLPVLYQSGGFDGAPATADQRRFLHLPDSILALVERLRADARAPCERIGFAAHSLRAVPPASLEAALAGLASIDATAPIHIHIAEQLREVDECIAWSGQRPVAWLLDHAPVDTRWCLVHATHMTDGESAAAAHRGAIAGLCPTTEANLGDGLFDVPRWHAAGGRWAIGSDSQACVDAAEELMLLEYGQRLASHRRNVLAQPLQPSVATAMTLAAVAGGAQACGRDVGGIAVGQQADLVVLDARHPALAGLDAAQMLDAHVFASDRRSAIDQVFTAGTCRVSDGLHADGAAMNARFSAVRQMLLAE